MATKKEKSPQVRELEKKLGRPLVVSDDESIMGPEHRKCVKVDAEGDIVGLNLSYCSISELSFLKDLPNLESLDLGNNKISGGKNIKMPPKLQALDLSNSGINDWAFIPKLTQLSELILQRNNLRDGRFLAGLSNLKTLNLRSNYISNGLFISKLTGLESLDLGFNIISDGSFLSDLSTLESLDLSANNIRDWSRISRLPSLKSLQLRNKHIGDGSFLLDFAGLTSLSLSNNSIGEISFLSEMTSLSELDLSWNRIGNTTSLSRLTNLTSLSLSYIRIRDWSFLHSLNRLKTLNIARTRFTDGSLLSNLKELAILDLNGNKIVEWSFLSHLDDLSTLILKATNFQNGSYLSELVQLAVLDLSSNRIEDLSFLSNLENLRSLNLCAGQFQDISSIENIGQLETINLSYNQITRLPDQLLDGKVEIEDIKGQRLTANSITVGENPLQYPPIDLIRQGYQAVMAWWRGVSNSRRHLREVKVLLIGDGAAGKTSLRKQIMGEPFDPKEKETPRISIIDWKSGYESDPLLVHFWDFGGQEIMHATHQFFLSERSLYLLVLDGRKEEDAEYWLKHIETFGGDSKVMVVLNKMDENPGFDVNNSFLRKKYPAILDFYRISCATGQGLGALKEALGIALEQVEMARSVWPGTWFNVKKRLEKQNCDFIPYDQFESICVEEEIAEDATHKILVRYLHDLGAVLHFQDFGLSDVQVLNPKWATHAVYRIINAPILAEGKGVLGLDRLSEILKPVNKDDYFYPRDKYPYIIGLMKKFELCYELDSKRILVPDLLAVDEPPFDFPTDNLLQFRFDYDFLPRSVMPRFIVKRHQDIVDNLRWRTGVVLEDKALRARAVIKCDVRDRFICIAVTGEERREYFAVIRKTFRDIHGSFASLKLNEKIPLPDHSEILLDYDELIGLERMGKPTIVVGKLEREYSVQQLLNGIESKYERERRAAEQTGRPGPVINQYFDKMEVEKMANVNMGNGNTFHGNVIIADVIKDSFKTIRQASNLQPDLKTILEELTQALTPVAEALPPDKAKKLSRDITTFTNEVTSESPQREWWELSLKGIKEAAQAVGEIGKTALELAAKAAPLLMLL